MDVILLIQPGHGLLQEVLHISVSPSAVAVVKSELCDPDGAASCNGAGCLDLLLEVVGACPLVGVPVDVDEIDSAASAVANEVLEPGETHGRTAVGHCGRAKQSLASEGLHVRLPCFDGRSNIHTGRSRNAKIGLIEAKKSGTATVDGLLRVGCPGAGEIRCVAPQHGNELESGIEARASFRLTPVVCPGHLRVLAGQREGQSVCGIVVTKTALAGVLDRSGTLDDWMMVSTCKS